MSSRIEIRRSRPLLGTFVEISAGGEPESEIHRAVDFAFEQIERVQRLMSIHEAQSDLSRLNREAHISPVAVDLWTYEVLETAQLLSERTGGAFDITVGNLLREWEFYPESDAPQTSGGNFRSVELLPDRTVSFRQPLTLDLGGIAKGFAVDKAVESLCASGIRAGSVNAGGEIRAIGTKALHLRSANGELVPFVELSGDALATSSPAMSKRLFHSKEVSALVDGKARAAALEELTISVHARTCVIADGLTKLFFSPGEDYSSVLAEFGACAYRYQDGELSLLGTQR